MSDDTAYAIGGLFAGLGIAGLLYLFTRTTQATTQQPAQQQPQVVEEQEYVFPDGSTELKITFPEGTRFVEKMHLEFTPTLEINGTDSVGRLFILIKKKNQLPYIFYTQLVSKDVNYKFDLTINDNIEFIIVRIRIAGQMSKINNAKIILYKR